jgi:hypothetical protein
MATVRDNDTLDMAGDWTLIYGYSPDIAPDKNGHWRPTNSLKYYGVHFDVIGQGDHGGMKFTGYYIQNPALGKFFGEALYAHRGTYVVQMRLEGHTSPGYIELLAGRHQLYKTGPAEILGGWVNVDGSSNIGSFVLVKGQNQK